MSGSEDERNSKYNTEAQLWMEMVLCMVRQNKDSTRKMDQRQQATSAEKAKMGNYICIIYIISYIIYNNRTITH